VKENFGQNGTVSRRLSIESEVHKRGKWQKCLEKQGTNVEDEDHSRANEFFDLKILHQFNLL